jgi:hypothetical protein
MTRADIHDDPQAPAFVPANTPRRYLVSNREDGWFIAFDGEEFGPYKTDREAKLFAIDAAHKLAEQGEETQVLVVEEDGEAQPAWNSGQDPYPPRL